jgi:hypothetical protein
MNAPVRRSEGAGPIDAPTVRSYLSATDLASLGSHRLLAAEIHSGRRVSIRIDTTTLMFFDSDTRELLRTRPNPLT